MRDLNAIADTATGSSRFTHWYVHRCGHISTTLLCIWCCLPLFMAGYDVVMGLTGGFPEYPADVLRSTSLYFPVAVEFYFMCALVLGLVTVFHAIMCITLSWSRIKDCANLKRYPWMYLFAVFLFWSLVCSFLAADPVRAIMGGEYYRDGFVTMLSCASLFVCATTIKQDEHRLLIVRLFCTVVSILSALMIIQEGGAYGLDVFFPSNFAVVFNQFNHFGYVLCMAILGFAGLYLFDRNAKTITRIVYVFGCALTTYTLLVNDTFGAYLAACVATIFLYVLYACAGNRLTVADWLPVLAIALLSCINIFEYLPLGKSLGANISEFASDIARVSTSAEDVSQAGHGRFAYWLQVIDYIKQHPIFGIGPSGLVGEYALPSGVNTHNEFIQCAAYFGIPGLVLYVSGLLALGACQLRRLKRIPPLAIACAGMCIAYFISSCFGNVLFNTAPYPWLFLGLASAYGEGEGPLVDPSATSDEKPTKATSKGVLVVAVVLMAVVAALLYVWNYLEQKTENNREIADLQLMRNASISAQYTLADNAVNGTESYWFDDRDLSLHPSSEGTPPAYGMGSSREGNGVKVFKDETGLSFDYSEDIDYSNKIMRVTINPKANDDSRIIIEWTDAP